MATEPLLCIVGPTGSGKSDLALRVAENTNGEIINADSVQIYAGFDIGSGKPSTRDQARVRHHLLGSVEPMDAIDAARWANLAEQCISEIRARGRRPILCGGSFLWVRALLFGLAPAPAASDAVRARHRAQVAREGHASLHADLARVDASTAVKLNPNDVLRVSRALEVFELSQKPMSAWQAEHGFRTARFTGQLMGIRHEPTALDARLRERARHMLRAGWLDEVSALLRQGYGEARAMSSVGYRQVRTALQLETPVDLTLLEDQIVRATRVFARRQRTWLRNQPVEWLSPEEAASRVEL